MARITALALDPIRFDVAHALVELPFNLNTTVPRENLNEAESNVRTLSE